jgi:hypothetical protein
MSGMYDGSYWYGSSEYDVTRVIPGEIETVRLRLSEALEQLGYRVLEENPLRARRDAQGLGKSGCSNDILAYQITINIGLKAAGPHATRVTFDYSVKHPYLLDADRAVLEREAEALAALTTARAVNTVCPACEAETGGSRFCRQCGAPTATTAPAELEVLRFVKQTHVSYMWFLYSATLLAFAVLLPLLLIFKGMAGDAGNKIIALATCLGVSGLLLLGGGLWRLSRVLKPTQQETGPPATARRRQSVPNTNALPPHPKPVNSIHPVTEATTDLLPEEKRAATHQS